MSGVCPIMATPTVRSTAWNSTSDSSTRNPGIDSSLSRVPPVWAIPRPEIMGT
jgi:hypothetical protein